MRVKAICHGVSLAPLKIMAKQLSLLLLVFISLFGSSTALAQGACRGLYTIADRPELKTQTLQERFAQMAEDYEWGTLFNRDIDFLRLINMASFYRHKNAKGNGTEIYGREVVRDWKSADEVLNQIPVGELKLTIELFQQIHRESTQAVTPFLKHIGKLIPNGFLPDEGGVFKKRNSVGKDPIRNPLDEATYQNIKNNPWLGGFLELPHPFSREGKRRGFILYARAKDTPKKLQELVDWYNQNKDKMDPIDLAADFQRAFVSIHPFVDGNGRTSRLFMDRILREHGLPPAVLPHHNNDIYLSQPDYRQFIREGVHRFYKVWMKIDRMKNGSPIPLVATSVENLKQNPELFKKMTTAFPYGYPNGQRVSIGGQIFTIQPNGLFYSRYAVPFRLHEGTLYPISDRTVWLYSQADLISADGKRSTELESIWADHLELYLGIVSKTPEGLDRAKNIKIASYDLVQQANKTGEIFLYDWQKPLFEKALSLPGETPTQILSNRLFMKTAFEQFPENNKAANLLAQYEYLDIEFREYQKYAEKHFPELVSKTIEARRKIHGAARTLIEPMINARNALTPEEQVYVVHTPYMKLFDAYYSGSKLSFPDYDTGLRYLGDTHRTILRSDNNLVRYVGFRSQAQWSDLVASLPFYSNLRKAAYEWTENLNKPEFRKKLAEDLRKKSPTFEKIKPYIPKSILTFLGPDLEAALNKVARVLRVVVPRIMNSKYDHMNVSEQVDRLVTDLAFHANGSYPHKEGISFSTSIGLYVVPTSTPQTIAFSGDATLGRLYVVRTKADGVIWNWGTNRFQHEYELIANRTIHGRDITHTFAISDLKPVTPLPTTITTFLGTYF